MGDITTSFVKQFKDTVDHLAQQMSERFRNAVRVEGGITGEEAYFDQLAATEAVESTTRHDDTPLVDSDWRRRRVTMRDWKWADLVDKPDKLKQIINPESPMAQSAAMAFARRIDKLVIDNANATSFTGKEGGTSTVLPAGQKIVHGGAGLTKAKMIAAKKILDENEAPNEDRFIAVSAEQIEDLLGLTEVTSSDFATVKALVEGNIDTWLGFKFIRTEQLNVDATPSRLVLAWQKTGLLLATALEPQSRITERADKNYSNQVFMSMSIGSTRMEEEKVVEIACNE